MDALTDCLENLELSNAEDFVLLQEKLRKSLLIAWKKIPRDKVKVGDAIMKATTADIRSRFAQYKKRLVLSVHYHQMIKKFEIRYGEFTFCPGSCSPCSSQHFTASCPTYQQVKWDVQFGSPLPHFIFDHWYKQSEIALSIEYAVQVLAQRIVGTNEYDWPDELTEAWEEHAPIVSHMAVWVADDGQSRIDQRKLIAARIKSVYNSIPTTKLKSWMEKAPITTTVGNNFYDLTQISERVFNLLHSGGEVDMDKYIKDNYAIGDNVILRCANCDSAGKHLHPNYDRFRYMFVPNLLDEDEEWSG